MVGHLSCLATVLLCLLLVSQSFSFHIGQFLSTHERGSTQFCGASKLFSTAVPQKLHECQECAETFQSRNALFRHIRDAHAEAPDIELLSTTVVVRYGYIFKELTNTGDDADSPINEFVANKIHSSFQYCLSEFLQEEE